jgi:hypothetical protein
MKSFSIFLQNQKIFSRTVEILIKNANFYYSDHGSAFGLVLRRFMRKVFCFLQLWTLEG